jgi:hypothetical protein
MRKLKKFLWKYGIVVPKGLDEIECRDDVITTWREVILATSYKSDWRPTSWEVTGFPSTHTTKWRRRWFYYISRGVFQNSTTPQARELEMWRGVVKGTRLVSWRETHLEYEIPRNRGRNSRGYVVEASWEDNKGENHSMDHIHRHRGCTEVASPFSEVRNWQWWAGLLRNWLKKLTVDSNFSFLIPVTRCGPL